MFQAIMDEDVRKVKLGDFNFHRDEVTLDEVDSAQAAAEALRDPRTDFVQIGRCGPQARQRSWGWGNWGKLGFMAWMISVWTIMTYND